MFAEFVKMPPILNSNNYDVIINRNTITCVTHNRSNKKIHVKYTAGNNTELNFSTVAEFDMALKLLIEGEIVITKVKEGETATCIPSLRKRKAIR